MSGSSHGPPKIIGIVPLSTTADTSQLLAACMAQLSIVERAPTATNVIYATSPKTKHRFGFLQSSLDLFDVLDVARVADVLIFVTALDGENVESLIDEVIDCHALALFHFVTCDCCRRGTKC